jgi:hypothetical protein
MAIERCGNRNSPIQVAKLSADQQTGGNLEGLSLSILSCLELARAKKPRICMQPFTLHSQRYLSAPQVQGNSIPASTFSRPNFGQTGGAEQTVLCAMRSNCSMHLPDSQDGPVLDGRDSGPPRCHTWGITRSLFPPSSSFLLPAHCRRPSSLRLGRTLNPDIPARSRNQRAGSISLGWMMPQLK